MNKEHLQQKERKIMYGFYGKHDANLTAESFLKRIDASLDLLTLRYAIPIILDSAYTDAEHNLAVAMCEFVKTRNGCYLSKKDKEFLESLLEKPSRS